MAGPKVAFHQSGGIIPFVEALAGVHRTTQKSLTVTTSGTSITTSLSEDAKTFFATKVGGGVDIALGKNVAIRAFQLDYLFLNNIRGVIRGQEQNGLRFSSGLVFRFGGN
jgi:opacity protein-like surface antigen